MGESRTGNRDLEQKKEIIEILADSDLYLELDLTERCKLLHFIAAEYFSSSSKETQHTL